VQLVELMKFSPEDADLNEDVRFSVGGERGECGVKRSEQVLERRVNLIEWRRFNRGEPAPLNWKKSVKYRA
jgi:hypothetical protein